MKRVVIFVSILTASLSLGLVAPAMAGGSVRVERISIRNLTSHQILSPPLIVVGRTPGIFKLGEPATRGMRFIAEEGDNSILATALQGRPGISSVIALTDPILPGESVSVTIHVRPGEKLSIATMLVQTNDGFTGVSALPLDALIGSIGLRSFDAGTEVNNEVAKFVPGPPFDGHQREPEGSVVMYHRGIQGIGDIDPQTYGWTDPVAQLRIQTGV